MPLFRFHRGSLQDSLKTTIIVHDLTDIVRAVVLSEEIWKDRMEEKAYGAIFEIEPYPAKDENFDKRIGWFTHSVSTNLYKENEMQIIGFLSEPLTYPQTR